MGPLANNSYPKELKSMNILHQRQIAYKMLIARMFNTVENYCTYCTSYPVFWTLSKLSKKAYSRKNILFLIAKANRIAVKYCVKPILLFLKLDNM